MSLLLPQTAIARLANLLLECSRESARIEKVFTKGDIAQMIGSSREMVTRLLTAFRRSNIIQLTADSVLIRDRRALENLLGSKDQIEPCCAIGPAKFGTIPAPKEPLQRLQRDHEACRFCATHHPFGVGAE